MKGQSHPPAAHARSRLERLLAGPGEIDIVEAVLCVATAEHPDLDIEREKRRVARLADEAADHVGAVSNPFARLDRLRGYLHEDRGFRGDVDNYDDPRNCYLNEVLDRRLGIPLTLSILFIELARRAGFEARGIGLPGHFIVGVTFGGRDILVDPFHGSQVVTVEDCQQLVNRSTGRASLFRPQQLAGTPPRVMLTRLLHNLKHIYLNGGDYARALDVVERLLLVAPTDTKEIRDRGFLQVHLGRTVGAITDLERYLALDPDAPDSKSVAGRLVWLRRRLAEGN